MGKKPSTRKPIRCGDKFHTTDGRIVVQKVFKKDCIIESNGLHWTITLAELLDPNKAWVSSSTYNAFEITQRLSKHEANQRFITAAARRGGLIAYLDADDANTSAQIKRLAPTLPRIAINNNPRICQDILGASNGELSVYSGTMHGFVGQQPKGSVHVWFDYCGTASGNKQMQPLKDIQLAVDRGIFLRNGGIAAFTFSTRDSLLPSATVPKRILNMFRPVYPKATILHSFRYHPSMLFFMLRV